ncbi:hypothetical protein NDU88_000703 [Pleurodeles waltl]|uniref:Reverse transcriptase RNase H-like domain-containing protein n=1 Tax=Pleurodeles waltl TaxID=8319 RepID=A0AAV7WG94_PLEWA|nr:hypothetical protein NDU88_000703 [Pleurodeles waltl]
MFVSTHAVDEAIRIHPVSRGSASKGWGSGSCDIRGLFTVTTDHKPLLPLFNGTASKPPPRIEKWMLQLQDYRCQLEYHPGSENPADYLSRHPRPASELEMHDARETEEYVRYVADQSRPLPMSMDEIALATKSDECLQKALTAIQNNQWYVIKKQVPMFRPDAGRTSWNPTTLNQDRIEEKRRIINQPRLASKAI